MRLQPNPRYNVMPTGKMRGETAVGEIKKKLFFLSFFQAFNSEALEGKHTVGEFGFGHFGNFEI